MSLADWYQLQHSVWHRTRRNQTATTPNAPGMAQGNAGGAATTNIDNLLPQNDINGNATSRDKKTLDPLFGPNIGAVTSGPAWTATVDKKVTTDELTPEVVNAWIEKSKDPSQPTTTLQALVNLKRPTIRLSPLDAIPEEAEATDHEHQHHHALEFEYDCDAPKCGIYVHVLLPKTHPDAPPAPPHHPSAKLLIFEHIVDGGFGKHLTLEEGALLELGRFEHIPTVDSDTSGSTSAKETSADYLANPTAISFPEPGLPQPHSRQRRRFTAFRFRRSGQNRSISGPSLAVVDAEPQPTPEATVKKAGKEEAEEDGVKVTIRLAALDDQCTELSSINEQVTYLHIVRVGTKPPPPPEGYEQAEDMRPWVVKVVKREATIGPHTFHLHEIYGLTSSSVTHAAPTSHTYPPMDTLQSPAIADDDDPQSECLLCLSSPREVVLLPCRHLVACKECALNMVEFGAGGNITQAVEPASATVDPNSGAPPVDGAPAPGGPGSPVVPTAPIIPQRRKRKAKGWFCPVCRQPYTSLLRITTAPPPIQEQDVEDPGKVEDTVVPALSTMSIGGGNGAEGRGFLSNALRPGFLRNLSLSRPAPSPATDVESAAGLGRPGS